MLQTRSGKRTAKAALKIAVDMATEGLISEEEAVLRVDPHGAGPAAPPDARSQGAARCADQGSARLAGRGLGRSCSMPIRPNGAPSCGER
jgi:pyruvate,orthophosphate dikinase